MSQFEFYSSNNDRGALLTIYQIDRNAAALIASVVLGAVVTFIWAEVSYRLLRRSYPEVSVKGRNRAASAIVGMMERLLLTSLAIWLQPALGPIAAAFFGVKAALSWGELKDLNHRASRTRYSVSFMNSLVSIGWAIACGIWAKV